MRTNLKEKVALVTGASSGLGDRFARVLAANGALVVLAARRMDRLKELRAQIESAGGAAHAVSLDVTDHDAIKAAIEEVGSTVGPIDILVNNSGVSTVQRLTEVEAADFDYVFNTNVRGSFFVAQAVARQMIGRARDTPNFRAASSTSPRGGAASAAADRRVLHEQGGGGAHDPRAGARVGPLRHQCQCDLPGYVRTEINAEHWETEAGRKLVQMLPRRRIGEAPTSTERCCCWWPRNRSSSTAPSSPSTTDERDMKTFRIEVPLRWGDMDAMAHVNNVAYFRLMEQARIQWFEQFGFSTLPNEGAPILAHCSCDFVRALNYRARR